MIVCRNMRLVFAIVWLSVPVLSTAGRPVFGIVSLSQLVHTSKLITVVTQAGAEASQTVNGCTSLEWDLTVVKTIKTIPGIDIKPGSIIRVRHNVTAYEDCSIRRAVGPSGASFAVYRYKPSIPDVPKKGRFIVFLEPSDQGFQLATDSSFESVRKQSKVESSLAK